MTCARPSAPLCAVMPPMLITAPVPARMRWGRHTCAHRNAPSSTTEITRRQSSYLISANGVSARTAALFTSMSSLPNFPTVASTIADTPSGWVTSAIWSSARPPPSRIRATVCSASARDVLALTMTEAPAAAREREMARPMFRAPPVTSATLPESSRPEVTPADWVKMFSLEAPAHTGGGILHWRAESAHALQEQQQPAQQSRVAEQCQAAVVPFHRVDHVPETVEDGGRGDGERDQAVDPGFRVPTGKQQRATGELQSDADPKQQGRKRRAEGRHALDVIADARPGEVGQSRHQKISHDQQPAHDTQPGGIALHRVTGRPFPRRAVVTRIPGGLLIL